MKNQTDPLDGADPSHYAMWLDQAVRYNDVDLQGHVNNTIIPVYFEAGRLALNRGPGAPPFEAGHGVAVAQVTIRYRKPVYLDSLLCVGTRVAAIGASSWTLAQGLFDGDACAALCETVLVCIDLDTARPAPLSEARRAYFERFRR